MFTGKDFWSLLTLHFLLLILSSIDIDTEGVHNGTGQHLVPGFALWRENKKMKTTTKKQVHRTMLVLQRLHLLHTDGCMFNLSV